MSDDRKEAGMALFIFLAAPLTVVIVSVLLLYLWGTVGHTNTED
ncbi:hypothetical protein ACFOQM_10470 [Paenibacillus sp. GCM10012307]